MVGYVATSHLKKQTFHASIPAVDINFAVYKRKLRIRRSLRSLLVDTLIHSKHKSMNTQILRLSINEDRVQPLDIYINKAPCTAVILTKNGSNPRKHQKITS